MAIILAFAFVVVLVTLRKPLSGLVAASNGYLVGMLASVSDGERSPAGVIVPAAAMATILGQSILKGALGRYRVDAADMMLLLMFLLSLLSCIYSDVPDVSLMYTLRLLFLGMSFFYAAKVAFMLYGDPMVALRDFFIGCAAVAAFFAGAALARNESASAYTMRLTLGTGSPIPLSLTLGLGMIASITLLAVFRERRTVQALVLAGFLVMGYAMVLTNTRSVMLSLPLALVAGVVSLRTRVPASALFKTGIIVAVAVASVAAIAAYRYELVERSFSGLSRILGGEYGASEMDRIIAWHNAAAQFFDHPFLGTGAGVFEKKYGMYPHNIMLEVGAGFGMAGLVLLILLLALTIWRCVRLVSLTGAVLLATVVFVLLVAQVSLAFWMHKMLFLCMGVVAANSLARKRGIRPRAFAKRKGASSSESVASELARA